MYILVEGKGSIFSGIFVGEKTGFAHVHSTCNVSFLKDHQQEHILARGSSDSKLTPRIRAGVEG
jgi:hypothetical protein